MVGTPVGLLALSLAKDPFRSERVVDIAQMLALAGMVVGTAMLALSLWSESELVFGMQLFGGAVSSLGMAVFTVLWG